MAVDFDVADKVITFTTNVGDIVQVGQDNPIRVVLNPDHGEPSPYVLVRTNLEALIDRKSFYRLVDQGEAGMVDGVEWFGVWSSGTFFPFIRLSEL